MALLGIAGADLVLGVVSVGANLANGGNLGGAIGQDESVVAVMHDCRGSLVAEVGAVEARDAAAGGTVGDGLPGREGTGQLEGARGSGRTVGENFDVVSFKGDRVATSVAQRDGLLLGALHVALVGMHRECGKVSCFGLHQTSCLPVNWTSGDTTRDCAEVPAHKAARTRQENRPGFMKGL